MQSTGMDRVGVQTELSVNQEGNAEDKMKNLQRQHTLFFKHSVYRNYNRSLLADSFSSAMRDWLGQIHDYFLLRAKSFNNSFQPLCGNFIFDVVFDSDEDDNVSYDDNDDAGSGGNDQQPPEFDYDNSYKDPYVSYPAE